MDTDVAARTAANNAYLNSAIPVWDDSDKLAAHYYECKAVTRWLGRNGSTPKESLKLFPVPRHAEAGRSCPGCNCNVYQACLIKATAFSSKE